MAHRHTIKYNPLFCMLMIYMLLILNQKTAPVLKISYNLLNLSLKLLQICSYIFTDLQDQILEKIFLQ